MKIILDTNYITAILDERDVWHKKAIIIKERLSNTNNELFFFDCVINEVVNVFIKRLKERKRIHDLVDLIDKLQVFVPRYNITWIYPEIEDYYDRVIETVKESNGTLNFHDALIVHVAKELEISHIMSFDKGFDKTGLKRIKDAGDI